LLLALALFTASPVLAQVSQQNRFEILGTVIADTAASEIVMPLGDDGVTLFEDGKIDEEKLREELGEEGRSINEGDIVTVTAISFDDDKIEIELNGGGKNKKGILDRLEVGVGSRTTPVRQSDTENANGSKVVLRFSDKAPQELTPDLLRELLSPVLDFNERNFMETGLDSLPEEFREAVLAKEAKIGMDKATVLMALGRPNDRIRERVDGIEREDWLYRKVGYRIDFITFENGIVVRIRKY
jgi:hypothetical protein